jgi:hypothetical protein
MIAKPPNRAGRSFGQERRARAAAEEKEAEQQASFSCVSDYL